MPVRVEEMCGLVFVNLDHDAAPLAELVGDLPQRLAPYRIETLDAVRARGRHPAGQLEGRGRQLHRGLPHPHRPPGPHADARLQALRRRGQRALPVVRRADARQAVEQPARAALRPARHPDAGPARARPDRLALRLHLSQHDDRPLPRPGRDLAAAAQRRGQHTGRVGLLSPREREPAHPLGAVGQPAAEHPRPRRGHRPRRQRPAGAADARLSLRAAVGAREGRRVVRRPHPGRPDAGDGRTRRCAAPPAVRAPPPTVRRPRPADGEPARRARADPGRGGRPDRPRGHRRGPHRADRDGGRRLHGERPLPLRDARGVVGGGARVLLRAGR